MDYPVLEGFISNLLRLSRARVPDTNHNMAAFLMGIQSDVTDGILPFTLTLLDFFNTMINGFRKIGLGSQFFGDLLVDLGFFTDKVKFDFFPYFFAKSRTTLGNLVKIW